MRIPVSSETRGEAAPRGRVLVVDDNPEAALFATAVLHGRGRFEVIHVADPAAALVLAATEPWDVVITDLDLPVMSGTELVTSLRRLAPRLPVAILTARPLDERLHGTPRSCRADAVLAKPVKADTLLAAVAALATSCRPWDNRGC